MKNKALPGVAIGLLIVILGVIGFKLSPQLRNAAVVTLPISTCSPAQDTCSTTLPDGSRLDFSMEPRPIRPLQPLRLIVGISESSPAKVEIDFNGAAMEMGYNRSVLQGSDGHFSGQAMLPVCVTGKMQWLATVLLTQKDRKIAIPFHFELAGR